MNRKDLKFIRKGKILTIIFALLSVFNIVLLINNKSYALFRKIVSSKRVIEIHTASKFPSKVLNENIKDSITSHTTETCKPTIEEDGIIYFSGTNDCVNFNYVWYSGKLWRISSINSDNTMKMITQDAITVTTWGEDTIYKDKDTGKKSWIYQWLNEDFLETLENQENIIVQNFTWNTTLDNNLTPVKPEALENKTIVDGKVGLLNAYEYYQAYKNASTGINYLNIGYYWWLITPYDSLHVRYVDFNGSLSNSLLSFSFAAGVRPSVNLKSDIKISRGEGTKENPYRIEGDKAVAIVDDKLNSRVSGEYVNFDGKKYRIVGIENETTKLTSVDYVREAATDADENGAVIMKNFGSSGSWATSVSNDTDDKYWSSYLNNTWYKSINETYKKMLVEGTYYLGQYGEKSSYKNTICSASNTTDPTKKCSKLSGNAVWTGYVGLPRVGEMFSAQLGEGEASSSLFWLITPNTGSSVSRVINTGHLGANLASVATSSVRPSITLNSNVAITGGKGTNEKPYEIKCDTCGK